MKILGIIPSRYASTRFPAKALADIGGKSMVQRVYGQAKKSEGLSKVIVATDHEAIFEHVKIFGGEVLMTGAHHQSGTDRCFDAYSQLDEHFDYIVNIQGDEPFIDPGQIDTLIACLDGETQLATLVKQIEDQDTIFNPNIVKAVFNKKQEALYFSRSPIPYQRGESHNNWINSGQFCQHIGIYAYRTDILKEITSLSVSSLEKAESLEQLRWLENGYKIKMALTSIESHGIDTPEDLEKAIAHFKFM